MAGSVQQASAALVNAALGQPTTQNTTLGGIGSGFDSFLAVDGNRAGNNNGVNFTHTDGGPGVNSWQVDLGSMRLIDSVDIWNRTNCCSGRLRDITVEFLNSSGATVAASPLLNPSNVLGGGIGDIHDGPGDEGSIVFPHLELNLNSPVLARTVRITRTGEADNILQLAEVEVQAEALFNLALGKPATQSSEYLDAPNFPAGNATNGNLGDFTHTNSGDSTASLTVDLQDNFVLDQIVLFNRGDGCCQERLRDITVQILGENGSVLATTAIINPGNALASPASITLDLHALFGNGVVGHQVRVLRAGAGGSGNDDGNVLSLGEVQVFGRAVVVPEPMTAMLGLMGLTVLAGRTGRRQRA